MDLSANQEPNLRKDQQPKDHQFAIAILSFNHPDLTAQTINSLLEHTLQVECISEIFLIHNGSKPANIERLKLQFPQLTHLELAENRGFSGGSNFAMKTIFKSHQWLLFLTNDLTVRALSARLPEVAGLYAPTIYFRKFPRVDSLGGSLNALLGKLRHLRTRDEFIKARERGQAYIPGTAFLVHRSIFEQIGGFDESLHTYWEDVDLSQRIWRAGFPLDLWSETELVHKVGKTCHKDSFYTLFLFQRNRRTVSKRYSNFPWFTELICRTYLLRAFLFSFMRPQEKTKERRKWLISLLRIERENLESIAKLE